MINILSRFRRIKILFLVGLLLFSSVCLADDDPNLSVYPPQGVMLFRGLDDKSSPILIQDGRASDLKNVDFSLTYGLRKRKGYKVIGDIMDIPDQDFAGITGIYYNKFSDGTSKVITTIGNRVYYYDVNTFLWTPIYYELTVNSNNQGTWASALDYIIGTNDAEPPIKIDKTPTLTNLKLTNLSDTLTKAKCIIWFKNRLILGNTVEAGVERPTRFRWSALGAIETYDDDDFIDIAALGGQEIEGFAELYDNLYIFLTDSIWKVSYVGGAEIFIVSRVIDKVGCIAKNSIQQINYLNQSLGLVFLSKDKKIYFFNGGSLTELGILIETTTNNLNASRLKYAVSAEDGANYYLSVTNGSGNTTNNLLLVFNYQIGEWTKFIDINANAIAKVIDNTNLSKIWFGNYDSFVYEINVSGLYNDVSAASGTFESVGTLTTTTSSGQQVIYDNDATFTTTGATVKIISGTAKGEERVVTSCVTTGIIVDSAFAITPDTTSVYSIGNIDAFYQTKWFDLGEAARRKQFGEIYLWAKEAGNVDVDINYALDFGSTVTTETTSLLGTGSIWGTAVWGTSTWGGQDALFKQIKLSSNGRYIRVKFADDEAGENFEFYGYSIINWRGDVQ